MPITASWWAALKSSPALKSSGCNLGSEELQTLCQPDSRVGSQSTACFRFGLLDVNCCSNSVKLALRYSFTTRGLGQVKLCLLITHTHTCTHTYTHTLSPLLRKSGSRDAVLKQGHIVRFYFHFWFLFGKKFLVALISRVSFWLLIWFEQHPKALSSFVVLPHVLFSLVSIIYYNY